MPLLEDLKTAQENDELFLSRFGDSAEQYADESDDDC